MKERLDLAYFIQAPVSNKPFQVLAARCGNDLDLKKRACIAMRLTDKCVKHACATCALNIKEEGDV